MLKKICSKKLLGSSRDQGEVFNKIYTVDGISFRLGEFNFFKHDFKYYKRTLNEIVSPKKTSFNDYQSEDGLELYSSVIKDKIVILSAGEIQRELYEIYLEGIWEIIPEENI